MTATITETVLALRPDLDTTLASLREEVGSESNPHLDVSLDSIRVHADAATPSISLGETEVPITDRGIDVLAKALQVPIAFINRLGDRGGVEVQGDLLNMVLDNSPGGVVRIEHVEGGGIVGIREPNINRVEPFQLVDLAERVLGSPDSPVQRLVDNDSEFAFDVHVPFDHSRGVGGDRSQRVELPEGLETYSWTSRAPLDGTQAVGDLTAAGLRFIVDRKRGLVPSVQPWSMRLACTNGMETTTTLTKVDGRGQSVEEVLADLEAKAEIAFSRMEAEIEHYYDLRNTPVPNPERRLRAMARERGIPERSLSYLLDAAPTLEDPTEFDVVNLVTNLANHASIRHSGGRLLLERAGGSVVSDHALRCQTCHTALIN